MTGSSVHHIASYSPLQSLPWIVSPKIYREIEDMQQNNLPTESKEFYRRFIDRSQMCNNIGKRSSMLLYNASSPFPGDTVLEDHSCPTTHSSILYPISPHPHPLSSNPTSPYQSPSSILRVQLVHR